MWQFAGGGTFGLSMKMGEREVANIQVISPQYSQEVAKLPGDHHTSRGRQRHRAEVIQIVPTANRMVIAKLLEKLQLHFPSFTTPS